MPVFRKEWPDPPRGRKRTFRHRREIPQYVRGGAIRSYGPGKFYTLLDSMLYEIEPDETASTAAGEFMKHEFSDPYHIIEIGKIAREKGYAPLMEAEYELIRESEGAIMREGGDGLVKVDYYEDLTDLEDRWEELKEDEEDYYSE